MGKKRRERKDEGTTPVNAEGLIDDGADETFDPNAGRLGAKRPRPAVGSGFQPKEGKKKGQSAVKDPEEAADYLQQWSRARDKDPTASWRFNKSTQSWLLRHMYKREKVSKEPFKLLLLYLEGLKGAARDRVSETAEEIIELEGGFTAAERDLLRAEAAAEGNSGEGNGGGSSVEAAANHLNAKEKERLEKFRLLRAQKVLMVLATDDEEEEEEGDDDDDDDDDGEDDGNI